MLHQNSVGPQNPYICKEDITAKQTMLEEMSYYSLYQYCLYSIHHDQVIFHEVKLETSLITNMFIYLSNSLIIECHQFCNSWFDFLTSFKHTKNGFKISCNNILLTYTCPTCRVNVNLNSNKICKYLGICNILQYGYCKNKKKDSSKV